MRNIRKKEVLRSNPLGVVLGVLPKAAFGLYDSSS